LTTCRFPFACVATDLVTGKEEVPSGRVPLPRALRATMSLSPDFFLRCATAKKFYVDGGLVGNLPTEVVRQMGWRDVVIAVAPRDTAGEKPAEIQSLFSVLGRSIDVVIREKRAAWSFRPPIWIVNVESAGIHRPMDYPKARKRLSTKARRRHRRSSRF